MRGGGAPAGGACKPVARAAAERARGTSKTCEHAPMSAIATGTVESCRSAVQ